MLPAFWTDCNNIDPDFITTFPTPAAIAAATAAGVIGTVYPNYSNFVNAGLQSQLPRTRSGLASGPGRTCAMGRI